MKRIEMEAIRPAATSIVGRRNKAGGPGIDAASIPPRKGNQEKCPCEDGGELHLPARVIGSAADPAVRPSFTFRHRQVSRVRTVLRSLLEILASTGYRR